MIKTATTKVTKTLSNLGNTLTQVLTLLGNNGSGNHSKTLHGLLAHNSSHPNAVSETQTLLDYLLAP